LKQDSKGQGHNFKENESWYDNADKQIITAGASSEPVELAQLVWP